MTLTGLGRGVVDMTATVLLPVILGGGGRWGGLVADPAVGGLGGGVICVKLLLTVTGGVGLV